MVILHVDSKSGILVCTLAGVCAFCVSTLQLPAQTTVRQSEALRERALTPAVRELRVNVAKPAAVAGQVLLDARKFKLAPSTANLARALVATDLAGTPVPMNLVDGATFSLHPRPDQWVVVRPASVSTEPMKRGVQWLPGVCMPPATSSGTTPDVLASYADFGTVPVVWDTTVDAYRVVGNVGVARNGDLTSSGEIGRTATVKMTFVGVSAATPAELDISHLGFDGEQEFSSTFPRTDTVKPVLVVRSNLGAEQPYALDVQPRVELTPRRNPILGLGLDEIGVVVECVQAHGAPVVLGAASAVTVACASGREADADGLVVSTASPQAQFRFRSTWLGPARIVATARTPSGAILGSVVVEQVMPWPQLVAALGGGALGGFARRFLRGARRRSSGRRVIEGLVVGLVAFVAGVLGVGFLNLPNAIVATVAGAFLTGVLAGFAGVVVLERLQSANSVPAAP